MSLKAKGKNLEYFNITPGRTVRNSTIDNPELVGYYTVAPRVQGNPLDSYIKLLAFGTLQIVFSWGMDMMIRQYREGEWKESCRHFCAWWPSTSCGLQQLMGTGDVLFQRRHHTSGGDSSRGNWNAHSTSIQRRYKPRFGSSDFNVFQRENLGTPKDKCKRFELVFNHLATQKAGELYAKI